MPESLLDIPPLNPVHAPVDVAAVLHPGVPAPRRRHKIIAVLPAYNAAKTLAATIADFPPNSVDEILLVDDCSTYVRANPLASLGIAVAAGFLISRLISAR